MPIGVVCGHAALMRRFDPERPMRVAYVVGTFSAHPVVMGAMNEFLRWVTEPSTAELYAEMNQRCNDWALATNRRLADAALPVQVARLGTIWTVLFTEPGRYNWLLQYYLRAQGLTLTWVGTGRCLSNMDYTAKDYEELQTKLVNAAAAMKADGWWPSAAEHPRRERTMRRRLVRETIGHLIQPPAAVRCFYGEVMRRKHDDHHASHSDLVNQAFHIVSSSVFLGCHALAFWDLTTAMGEPGGPVPATDRPRVLEPPCHDKEALLLGFNTPSKTAILATYLLIPVAHLVARIWTGQEFGPMMAAVAREWFIWTGVVVGGRVAYLVWLHGIRLALVWLVKLVTDPVTDLIAYSPRYLGRA
jgi:glutamate-1-semialdehyde 2,1-aminomutase